MLQEYGFIGLLLIAGILFPTSIIFLSFLLGRLHIRPHKPDPIKNATYECGMETIGTAWVQFNFRYYYYALLFVIFDVETVFLFPWAVAFRRLELFGFIEMLIFIAILLVGYAYAWRKGALEWK